MNKELLKGPNWSKGLITAVKTVPKCDYNTDYKNNNIKKMLEIQWHKQASPR